MSQTQKEPSTSVALMSRQPEPETAPLKPKKTLPPPKSMLRAQLTPVIAVSACTAVVLGATAFWATSYAAEPVNPVVVDERETPSVIVEGFDSPNDVVRVFAMVRASVSLGHRQPPLTTFESLASSLRVAPRATGGKPGVLLLGVSENGFAQRVGLRGGDHLTAINGRSLLRDDDGPETYAVLRDARELDITLVRDGAVRDLRFNGRDMVVASRETP